ncbi:N-6 DNA methylase [Corynebacterium striatum]|uniref:N-6 DNA methylase n=1 Tax=Corynebacterium striatum TaxID=43770 RepID=UPI003B5CD596
MKGISRLGGEQGLRGGKNSSTLFPDILLMSDIDRVLMGWELKFPETPVTDPLLIENAIEKAQRMGTSAFLLWNVNQAVMYAQDSCGDWHIIKNWSLAVTVDRCTVDDAKAQWQAMARDIIAAISDFYVHGKIVDRSVELVLDTNLYADLIQREVKAQTKEILYYAQGDVEFSAQMRDLYRQTVGIALKNVKDQDAAASLARDLIVNWVGKFLFAHQLKKVSKAAYEVSSLVYGTTPTDALAVFKKISSQSDFASILREVFGQRIISDSLWKSLLEINMLLINLTDDVGGRIDFSQSLAAGIAELQGKNRGQFATPRALARLAVGLTMKNLRGAFLDPCSGTGTIARAAYDRKRKGNLTAEESTSTVWASDKFSVPVGFTGISLADLESFGVVQQVLRSDVADLRVGASHELIDPMTGTTIQRAFPPLETIVSNLPFLRFEKKSESQDLEKLRRFAGENSKYVTDRSDLFAYILAGLPSLMSAGGRIGVILSNSWLGTGWGRLMQQMILDTFELKYIAFDGGHRWFRNASVVGTLLVLEKPTASLKHTQVKVITSRTNLNEWDDQRCDDIIDHCLTENLHPDVDVQAVDWHILSKATEVGLSWASAVYLGSLVEELLDITCLAADHLEIYRGTRPGQEKFHFLTPQKAQQEAIESDYLSPLLHDPKTLLRNAPLEGVPANQYIFCCHKSTEELRDLGHTGALAYIAKWQWEKNGTGKPLPEVLKGTPYWYSSTPRPIRGFFSRINPDQVYGVHSTNTVGGTISQRFIGYEPSPDMDQNQIRLLHALMNSAICMLWQESLGFARGEGVLDLNKNTLEEFLRIPDPSKLNEQQAQSILDAFTTLSNRSQLPVFEEFIQPDRKHFDETILAAFGMANRVDALYDAILHQVKNRRGK